MTEPRYFLMKAEPESRLEKGVDVAFSINDLAARGSDGEPWDGVRNAEASKIMRTEMREGDLALFYHSNCKVPGAAGVMRIKRAGYPDSSAFDPKHPYYDARSDPERPRWYRVDVEYVRHLRRFLPLRELRACPELADMQLLRRPQLSVQRVTPAQWDFIMDLELKDVA